jgi:Fur family ferric uptake transcriptional regulator
MKRRHQHSDHSLELPELTDKLRRKSRRVTIPRQAILGILRRQRRPLTIKDIHGALSPGDCDLATVYRSMHLLERMGIVKRFDLGEGSARFVELEECFPEELQERIASRSGYKKVTHRLEFFGVCPRCQ